MSEPPGGSSLVIDANGGYAEQLEAVVARLRDNQQRLISMLDEAVGPDEGPPPPAPVGGDPTPDPLNPPPVTPRPALAWRANLLVGAVALVVLAVALVVVNGL